MFSSFTFPGRSVYSSATLPLQFCLFLLTPYSFPIAVLLVIKKKGNSARMYNPKLVRYLQVIALFSSGYVYTRSTCTLHRNQIISSSVSAPTVIKYKLEHRHLADTSVLLCRVPYSVYRHLPISTSFVLCRIVVYMSRVITGVDRLYLKSPQQIFFF